MNTVKTMMLLLFATVFFTTAVDAQIVVRGKMIITMAGPPIENGVVVIRDGKIAAVGTADEVEIPQGSTMLDAEIVTPGLIDAHSVVGLAGQFNYDHDQDQLESSDPIQPELRAVDAYNTRERLVDWIRSFGVTTIHTGHGPGELVSGQTIVIKTTGNTVDDAVIKPLAMVAATLAESGQKSGGKSPGNRSKMMAMLRAELIKAREYQQKLEQAEEDKTPSRDLGMEALLGVLNGEIPLMVTAHRAQDIGNALRLAEEFDIELILDGAAEAYLLIDEIKAAGVPVIIHATMKRAFQESQNLSMETAATLHEAGIPIALQSGYESYVPKTRIVLYEAAVAASYGLGFDAAMAAITIDAAKILGIDDRVGSIEVGKDGDLALYDGDPFEYTSHCTGVIIEGVVVSDVVR